MAATIVCPGIKQVIPLAPEPITGDSLYSKQPFIDQLKQNGMSFILVAKPTDHKILYQWFTEFRHMGETLKLEIKGHKDRRHLYEWVNDIALNGTKDADNVNYFEYTMFKGNKATYHSSWVTDIPITQDNIIELVKGGRERWKIENEAFSWNLLLTRNTASPRNVNFSS